MAESTPKKDCHWIVQKVTGGLPRPHLYKEEGALDAVLEHVKRHPVLDKMRFNVWRAHSNPESGPACFAVSVKVTPVDELEK